MRDMLLGATLAVTFFVCLGFMLMPIFDGKNFIQYADDLFSSYAKRSSYFIDEISREAKGYAGKSVEFTLKVSEAEKVAKLYEGVANVRVEGNSVILSGDLAKIFEKVLRDSDKGYWNDENYFVETYGMSAKETLYLWHTSLSSLAKSLEKEGRFEESLFIQNQILMRAVEPAYNFFGVEPIQIEWIGGALLVFYVVYTVWWGAAIYYLLAGFGIRAEKAKEKKEV